MKITLYFTSIFLLITSLVSCNSQDDEFYDSIYLSRNNMIYIDTQTSYNVGDFLAVSASFSRYFAESASFEMLDLYKTSNTNKFFFNYNLEKLNNGVWEKVEVNTTTNYYLMQGDVVFGEYISGICVLNTVTNSYEFRGAITLTEPGSYRMYVGNEINSLNSSEQGININIKTTVTPITDSYYTFSVN